ncbi:MAG: 50S ribosomal protein L22 [Nitrospirae bacterium]|nr:50S ribosomal protein L22 [Nitrospirota bacterium]MBF0534265.1 50S ribosomal protein L22 [Nitrospirota bacterium]MBF0615754.1 50S ribosomal protein L22 [Nitrospirota bacterium]
MESKALLRYARITPQKARRVVRLIAGKRAQEAMTMLEYMPYRGAVLIKKLLKSAMANAEQHDVADPDNMKLLRVYVDEGPMMRRIMPRAMGRANVIKKKTSHITVVLSE